MIHDNIYKMMKDVKKALKPLKVSIGDTVQLRKAHPCGSDRWRVYRVGADIGIRCEGCGRRVLLPRQKLARRVKAVIVPEPDEVQAENAQAADGGPA